MSTHPMVLQIGSTVFVHGGLHPEHVHVGVDNLNSMAQVLESSPFNHLSGIHLKRQLTQDKAG